MTASGFNNPSVRLLPRLTPPLTQGRLKCGFNNPSVRLLPRLTPPSYIGLPQRLCEAKDLWEEEQRASEQSREKTSGLRNLLRCDEEARGRRGGEEMAVFNMMYPPPACKEERGVIE